jgi:adenine-specific DNA-methyltransferase
MASLIQTARELRSRSTDAERLLWHFVRNRHMSGYRFRRQVPLGPYIADFVCLRARLIVELDGSQHDESSIDELERTRYLARSRFRVIRFWNNEVLQQTEAVLESILEALIRACPHPDPLPHAGEGE